MDREAWWATVHRVTKSWTRLKRLSMHTGIAASKAVIELFKAITRLKIQEQQPQV